jgi:hypothetical protein
MSHNNKGLAMDMSAIVHNTSQPVTTGYAISNTVMASVPVRLSPDDTYFSWHVVWTADTGNGTGTLTVQVSNKEEPDPATSTDWVSPQNNTFPANPNNNDTSTYEDFHQSGAKWMRLVYTTASNTTDTLRAWYNVKKSG